METFCVICSEELNKEDLYTHSCSNSFHKDCIKKWITFDIDDIIVEDKLKCPACRIFVCSEQDSELVSNISLKTIKELNHNEYFYKMCKKCNKIFDCGLKLCDQIIQSFPSICSDCEPRLVNCPKCNLQLEHRGGCAHFVCCGYGIYHCKKSKCDHASTDFIKFCGHHWSLNFNQMNNEGILREDRIVNLFDNLTEENLIIIRMYLYDVNIRMRFITHNPNNIQYIPRWYITEEICNIAMNHNPNNIRYIPLDILFRLINKENIEFILNHNNDFFMYVPKKYKTKELCEKFFNINEKYIHNIPHIFRTKEMYDKLIEKDCNNIKYVPREYIDKEMCEKVLSINKESRKFIPKMFLNCWRL